MKEKRQQINRVGDIDLIAVVGVGGIDAGGRDSAAEEIKKDEDRVGDVDFRIVIGIPAQKCRAGGLLGGRFRDGDVGNQRQDKDAITEK